VAGSIVRRLSLANLPATAPSEHSDQEPEMDFVEIHSFVALPLFAQFIRSSDLVFVIIYAQFIAAIMSSAG
jgi:hypothetical protein